MDFKAFKFLANQALKDTVKESYLLEKLVIP